jgi:hypothetical protein
VPWYWAQLLEGRTIRFERLPEDLPEAAVKEREYVRRTGMQSQLTVPIAVGGRYVSALATAAFRGRRVWSDATVARARTVGQILANAVYRQRTEAELRARLAEIRELQARLETERVGGVRTYQVDARIVAATNRDLPRAIAEGRFREDLYYRLAAFPIVVPALRERREDIPLLVWAVIDRRQADLGRHIQRVPKRAMEALVSYAWPGNVRELQQVVERALILSPGPTLQLEESFAPAGPGAGGLRADRLDQVERAHILRVLERCGWRIDGQGHAAEVLRLHPNTLRSRMQRLGIKRPAPQASPRR